MKRLFMIITAVAFIFVLSGCIGGGGLTPVTEQYIIEYTPPAYDNFPRVDESIKVARFSVSRHLNCSSMFYKPAPFKREAYNYHRWRVNPGDMVTDCLLRDLRASGLFRAVFSCHNYENARFLLEGHVEEFIGLYEQGPGEALLKLNITLLDMNAENVTSSVIFQKNYHISEALESRTSEGLTRGMSKAMYSLSEQITRDIHESVD
ncbi:MAG: ABC-type transport auxiliary lipoprotein family protein [Thermodesulfobacteriota bacterium]|nr:ABC-type transport auxiliary lipoprotein family protein [Thermodesulfobacteriota bacterium]